MSSFLYKKIWHGISIHTRKCIPTLSSDESTQHTRYYLRGYKEGYRDGMNR